MVVDGGLEKNSVHPGIQTSMHSPDCASTTRKLVVAMGRIKYSPPNVPSGSHAGRVVRCLPSLIDFGTKMIWMRKTHAGDGFRVDDGVGPRQLGRRPLLAVLLFGHGVLTIEDRRADGDGRQDVNPVHPEVAIRADVAGAAVVKLNQIRRGF